MVSSLLLHRGVIRSFTTIVLTKKKSDIIYTTYLIQTGIFAFTWCGCEARTTDGRIDAYLEHLSGKTLVDIYHQSFENQDKILKFTRARYYRVAAATLTYMMSYLLYVSSV